MPAADHGQHHEARESEHVVGLSEQVLGLLGEGQRRVVALVGQGRCGGQGRERGQQSAHGRSPHRIGWWTVTSLVPSGKVASTWTSWIISAMPSITWARVITWAPAS